MRQARRLSSAAGLTLLTLFALLLLTPAAAAATADGESPAVTPVGSHSGQALASTGLDITVPVIIGLSTLILGIALVAWAFLRTGSAEQHH